MNNILIINAHHQYPFSAGKLNKTLTELVAETLGGDDREIKTTHTDEAWNVEEELEKHQWTDVVILQSPVNWMMMPWTFKKYMDEVYTAGMGGALCDGDGRHADAPKKNYGNGGTLTGKKYMLSLTFNAPAEAFSDPAEYLFQGKSVDDLWFPMHMNFRFFGMEALPTFASYDVMKNPTIEADLERYKKYLLETFN